MHGDQMPTPTSTSTVSPGLASTSSVNIDLRDSAAAPLAASRVNGARRAVVVVWCLAGYAIAQLCYSTCPVHESISCMASVKLSGAMACYILGQFTQLRSWILVSAGSNQASCAALSPSIHPLFWCSESLSFHKSSSGDVISRAPAIS